MFIIFKCLSYFIPLSFCLNNFWGEGDCNLLFILPYTSTASFWNLSFNFCTLKIIFLGVVLRHLSWCPLSSQEVQFVSDISLRKFCHYLFKYFFCLFFTFFSFYHSHNLQLYSCSTVFGYPVLCCCFLSFLPLLCGFWRFYYYVLWLRDSFLNCVQSTISSSKIFFIFVAVTFLSLVF